MDYTVKNSNERVIINLLRGFAIFLMIWGHLIQHICIGFQGFALPVHRWIYSFHMPLFMLISGYLFFKSSLKYSFKDILYRKSISLIYPIITNNILHFLLVTCLMDFIFQRDFHTFFSAQWANLYSAPWFLWSLFASIIPVAIL